MLYRDSTRIPTVPTPQQISQKESIFLIKNRGLSRIFGAKIGDLKNLKIEKFRKFF